jgi:hypothetical protein
MKQMVNHYRMFVVLLRKFRSFLSEFILIFSDHSVSKLTDLSLELFRGIFDYLALGDIYYSFYDATKVSIIFDKINNLFDLVIKRIH